VADSDPVTREEFFQVLGDIKGIPVKTCKLPEAFVRFHHGSTFVATMTLQCKMASFKLRNAGFQFKYPTIKQGLANVMERY
jgi:NAD dependent epimerase/dehydratase family enzyme